MKLKKQNKKLKIFEQKIINENVMTTINSKTPPDHRIKISNIDMKIIINKNNKIPNKKGKVISTNKFKNEIIPSFTKKLFRVASNHQ